MTITTVLDREQYGFTWIDVIEPTRAELEKLANTFGLHKTSVEDCMQPMHLPKFEQFTNTVFMIARSYDETAAQTASSVQELTRKLAIFAGEGFVITVHRCEHRYVSALKHKWSEGIEAGSSPGVHVVNDLLRGVIESFQTPLDDCEDRLEGIESAAFNLGPKKFAPQDSYFLLRRATVIERMLRANVDVVTKCPRLSEASKPYFQDLREQGDRLVETANNVGESVQNVISISVSIADQKTNEVMRVLTVFSVFFLPLNFLAGLYGMNFEEMPFLKSPSGFTGMVSVMMIASFVIFVWFKRRRWL